MKKVIIIAAAAVLLTGAAFTFKISKNSGPSAETSVAVSNGSVTYIISENQDGQTDPDIASKIDIENRTAQVLSEFDWVTRAVLTISDSNNGTFVSAVLTVSREPSSDEADSAAYIISQYFDEDVDILITDQDSNVIYPLLN